jgi:hypothetical protein
MPALAVAPLHGCVAARRRPHAAARAASATRCAATPAAPRADAPRALVLLPLAAWIGALVVASAAPAFAAVDSGCAKSCFKECIALAPKSEAYCKDNCDGACDSSAKDAPKDE